MQCELFLRKSPNMPDYFCSGCNQFFQNCSCSSPGIAENSAPRLECFICHKKSFLGIQMPYPSRYDGEWICGECVRDILDVTIGACVEYGPIR